jgi:murein DD-endopeptidase MepM/ murein hydrolase activator NlpD
VPTPVSRPGAPRAPARARRATATPLPHDGWTFVLIPPGAHAKARTLRVSVRRLRFALASFFVLLGATAATGAVLVFALSFIPPAQDESRGVELGVFASTADPGLDSAATDSATPAGIAAASAGAGAPRTSVARPRVVPRPRVIRDEESEHSIIESLPVVGEITSRFAKARRHPLLGVVRRHDGIDIAAAAGTPIIAPAAGRVIFAGRKFGYGNTVDIDHGSGVVTRYAHARSLMVREGDEVAAGAVIATVGRTGLATAPHLHYEVRFRGRQMNPLTTPIASLLAPKQAPALTPSAPADSISSPAQTTPPAAPAGKSEPKAAESPRVAPRVAPRPAPVQPTLPDTADPLAPDSVAGLSSALTTSTAMGGRDTARKS